MWTALDRLESLLAEGLREDARRSGVREATARVLLALDPDRGIAMGEVALRLARDASTATRFVDRAVAEGLALRREGVDRRRRLAELTQAGIEKRELVRRLRESRTEALLAAVRAATGLGPEQVVWFLGAVVEAAGRGASDGA